MECVAQKDTKYKFLISLLVFLNENGSVYAVLLWEMSPSVLA